MIGARRYEVRRRTGHWQAGDWTEDAAVQVLHVIGSLRPAGDRLQLLAASGAVPSETKAVLYLDPRQPELHPAVQGAEYQADRVWDGIRELAVIGETPHQLYGGVPHRLYLLAEIPPATAEVLP